MRRGILLVMVLLLTLSILAPALAQEEAEADLRLGILPVLNALTFSHPWLLGYFEEEGFTIQRVPVSSAQELRAAMDAGELDGFLADLITALVLIDGGHDLRLVRHVEISSHPMFTLIARADSGIMSAEDLRGAQIGIGISEATVIQYVTEGMLASAGISADEVEFVHLPTIVDRLDQLLAGEIQVATLPLPMSSKAVLDGHQAILDVSAVGYVPEAYVFTASMLEEKGDVVRAYLRAVERSVTEINVFQDFESGLAGLGEAYLASEQAVAAATEDPVALRFFEYVMEGRIWPNISPARVPTAEEYAHAHDWALAAGVISAAIAFEDVIDGSYLPEMMADDGDDMADDGDDMAEDEGDDSSDE